MMDEDPFPPEPSQTPFVLSCLALMLVVLLGAYTTYLAVRVSALNTELGQLRMAHADLKDAVLAIDAPAEKPPAESPASSSSTSSPPAPPSWFSDGQAWTTGAPPPVATPPAQAPGVEAPVVGAPAVAVPPVEAPPSEVAADPAAAPAPASPFGTGYAVRVFAPTQMDKAKLAAFVGSVKELGFNVEASDDGLFEPDTPSMSYHASAAQVAQKLNSALKAKRRNINLELRASESIPDSAKNILIINLTSAALN